MPKVPNEELIYTAVRYLGRRQLQGRPTTLRQLSKRMGIGGSRILGIFEQFYVIYTLIPYAERSFISQIEVLLKEVPELIAERSGVPKENLEQAYVRLLEEVEVEKEDLLTVYPHTLADEDMLNPVETVDALVYYRITEDQFQTMLPELISYEQLMKAAKKRGYRGSAIWRATGGDRMEYKLPGPLWRPYIFRKKRYYLKEVLNYLDQSDLTYKKPSTARLRREKRTGIIESTPHIDFSPKKLFKTVKQKKRRELKRKKSTEFLT
jgi:hypothetical protein